MIKLRTILLYNYIYYLLFLIILIVSLFYINYVDNKCDIKKDDLVGIIVTQKINGNKLTIEIKSKNKVLATYFFKSEEELKKYNYKLGDKLLLKGVYSYPKDNTNFNLFSYKKYLLSKKIYTLFEISSMYKISNNKNILYYLKQKLIDKINTFPRTKNYLENLIIGSNSQIEKEVLESYRSIGVSHLFAISGMHITFLSVILLYILKKLKVNEERRYFLVFIFVLYYMFLTNFIPPMMVASIFFFLLSINKLYYFEISAINIFILSISINLLINPYIIYSIGFLFSSIISFFLILARDILSKYKNYIYNLFLVSLIAFLASIPIISNYFFEINIMSPIINIFYVPYVTVILFPTAIITIFIPYIENIFYLLINIIEKVSLSISDYNVFKITISKGNILIYILFYLSLIMLIKTKYKYISALNIILVVLYLNNIVYFNYNYKVILLDVNQGDSSVIVLPKSKKAVIIDTGGKQTYYLEKWQKVEKASIADSTLIPFLKSIGINDISYLILTHGDYDHMGEAISLVNNFEVENVIFNCGEYNDLEKELIEVLEQKNINYYSCIKELNINKYKLQFLNTGVYDNENDNSSVIYLNYNNYKFLFMGDAGVLREKDISEKYNLSNIDFLKVGHHGSNTSSSEEFINSINPKYSLISVGKNNRYGHPKESVLDILEKSKVYRTDIDGSIEIKLNKNGYKVRTCPP